MIDFQEVKLDGAVVHLVGNKGRQEGTRASANLLALEGNNQFLMLDYFLSNLKFDETYRLSHPTDLEQHVVAEACRSIFRNPDTLYPNSKVLLQHLYDYSTHPNTKSGEMYVAFFKDVLLDDELVDAVGIFKAETKDTFCLLQSVDGGDFNVNFQQGSSTEKLDKGVLIFNTMADDGYRVITTKTVGKNNGYYFTDDFLRLLLVKDDAYKTKHVMGVVKGFIDEIISKDHTVDYQVEMSNKALDYFNKREQFDYNEFKQHVIGDNYEQKKQLDYYKLSQEELDEMDTDGFFIAPAAVKKLKKGFRDTIKTDTGFEIKVKDTQDENLVRGFDEEKQLFFYKVYFNQEC